MIIKSTPADELLPPLFRQNIFTIHAAYPLLKELEENSKFYYAGGYPMALLAAPRWKTCNTKIKEGYYSDIDIYHYNSNDFEKTINYLEKNIRYNYYINKHTTNNAITYRIANKNNPNDIITVQVILKFNSPEELLNTFDFTNCAVGLDPKTQTFYLHKDTLTYHTVDELQILNPWMLEDLTNEKQVITQLLRFKKYCTRWGYHLSKDSLNKLLSIAEQIPNLTIKKNFNYGVGSGNQTVIAQSGANIWSVLKEPIVNSPYWDPAMDPNNLIKALEPSQSPIPTEESWNSTNEIPF